MKDCISCCNISLLLQGQPEVCRGEESADYGDIQGHLLGLQRGRLRAHRLQVPYLPYLPTSYVPTFVETPIHPCRVIWGVAGFRFCPVLSLK